MQKKGIILAIVIILIIIGGGVLLMGMKKNEFNQVETPAARSDVAPIDISTTLQEVDSSGVSGTLDVGKKVDANKLVFTMSVVKSANLTATVKSGSCSALGQDAYQLGTVNANPQVFEIDGAPQDLIGKLPLAVVLTDSNSKMLSCGDINYENEESEKAEGQ